MYVLNRIWLPALTVLLLVLLLGFGTLLLYGSGGRIPARVQVGAWSVEGLTFAEFQEQLRVKSDTLLDQRVKLQLPYTAPDRAAHTEGVDAAAAERSFTQLGLTINTTEITEKVNQLQEGSIFRRAYMRWTFRGQVWSLSAELSTEKLHQSLQEAFPAVYRKKPRNAGRIVQANDTIEYLPETRVLYIDEVKLGELLNASLADQLDAGASISKGTAVSIRVPLRTVAPSITLDSMRAQGIERKIGEFSTAYPQASGTSASVAGRLHNVRSTAESLQDVLLAPGEVFDYAPYIEQTEKTFGYREAPVIVNGKLVPGIGGGICQVSSTLYNAILRTGLEVVERRNHSLPVSYCPLGQDATFASGYINFKFRNNTQHHLLIRTMTDAKGLTVKLFGQTPPELTYEIESKTIETLEPPVKYVHNPDLRPGAQELITQGKPGYIVETYRIKKNNGVFVSREKISRDTYAAQPTVIATNSGRSEPERSTPVPGGENASPYVEDGVKGPSFR